MNNLEKAYELGRYFEVYEIAQKYMGVWEKQDDLIEKHWAEIKRLEAENKRYREALEAISLRGYFLTDNPQANKNNSDIIVIAQAALKDKGE